MACGEYSPRRSVLPRRSRCLCGIGRERLPAREIGGLVHVPERRQLLPARTLRATVSRESQPSFRRLLHGTPANASTRRRGRQHVSAVLGRAEDGVVIVERGDGLREIGEIEQRTIGADEDRRAIRAPSAASSALRILAPRSPPVCACSVDAVAIAPCGERRARRRRARTTIRRGRRHRRRAAAHAVASVRSTNSQRTVALRRRRRSRVRGASSPGPATGLLANTCSVTGGARQRKRRIRPASAIRIARRASRRSAIATSRRSFARVHRVSQRRPDVTMRSRRQSGRPPARFRRVDSSMSSISGWSGKPPTASKSARSTKMPWSPVAMPVSRERAFIMRGDQPQDAGTPGDRHVEPSPAPPRSRAVRARMAVNAGGGQARIGVQEQQDVAGRRGGSGVHLRTRGPAARRTRGRRAEPPARASRRALPPSTTITSCPAARSGCSGASVATMPRASSSAGTMIETRIRGRERRAQASAPPQLDPCPAVQP